MSILSSCGWDIGITFQFKESFALMLHLLRAFHILDVCLWVLWRTVSIYVYAYACIWMFLLYQVKFIIEVPSYLSGVKLNVICDITWETCGGSKVVILHTSLPLSRKIDPGNLIYQFSSMVEDVIQPHGVHLWQLVSIMCISFHCHGSKVLKRLNS